MKSLLTRSAFLFLSLCGLAHGQGSLPPTVAAPATTPSLFPGSFTRTPVSLTLYGTVNANGNATTAQFEYGLTTAYGSTLPLTLSAPDGTAIQDVNVLVTGLMPNTTYHYRLTATNAHGTSSTTDQTTRTLDYAYLQSHFAGTTGGPGIADGTGSEAKFVDPRGIARAPEGHFYVADGFGHTIRKVTAGGKVTTFAGLANTPGSTDGSGSAARFNNPTDLAVDGGGNVYVTDSFNNTVRKITSTGVVTTLAGTAGLSGSVDGTSGSVRFSQPNCIAVDASGNLYVSSGHAIRKITSTGLVTTIAGSADLAGSTDGTGTSARFHYPSGLAVAGDGSLMLADTWNHTIRKINTATGEVSTLAGLAGSLGTADGSGDAARFLVPYELALSADGIIYVASFTGIRLVTPAGLVTTLDAGVPELRNMSGLAFSLQGDIFFTQTTAVYRRNSLGVVSLVAGDPAVSGSADGQAEVARFNFPLGADVDAAGNLYVADQTNHTVRKVSSAGVVSTLAGQAGVSGNVNGVGSSAQLSFPTDLAVDGDDNVFVSTANGVRKITPAGIVSTLASENGFPGRIAVDGSGNVFLIVQNCIRKITSSGFVSTLAGDVATAGSVDGTGAAARFNQPRGLTVDGTGNVFVADTNNSTIRSITPAGEVTTYAGAAGTYEEVDGPVASARFTVPSHLCFDAAGGLYVSNGSSVIRRISPSGDVTSFQMTELEAPPFQFPIVGGNDLVCLPGGTLCFVNSLEHKLQRLTPGPLVGRRPVSGLNTTSATLNARLDPNAPTTTTALFEYGTSTSYGSTASVTLSPDIGLAEQSVSASLSGLLPATTYHYRLTATNARGTNTTSNGTFTTLNLQQGWRQTYFGSPTNEGNAADTFDHDGDGIVNLLEWATGLNPTINSTLPASSTVSGTDIEYHYTRLVAAIAAGTIFTVEWNDTLSPLGWSSAGVVETILSDNGTTQQVKATLPAGSSGKRFVRLRVTGAP